MAERRMFSQKIVESDVFTELPPMSQLLYFHLAMMADDEGFVDSPRRTRLSIGASEEDLEVLVETGYIIKFPMGSVVCITHWHVHNQIRGDRRKETIHQKLKAMLVCDNKVYVVNDDNQLTTNCQPIDGVGKGSIDKSSVDKVSIDKESVGKISQLAQALALPSTAIPMTINWFAHKWHKSGEQTESAIKSLLKLIKRHIDQYGEDAVSDLIDTMIAEDRSSIYFDRLDKPKDKGKSVQSADIDYGSPEDFYKEVNGHE